MKNSYTGNFFFILSKGLNAGKPMDKPCPNCFVLFAKDEQEKDLLFWLCFGLWQANHFQLFLTGSVIPFIRLDDLREVINQGLQKVQLKPEEFKKSVDIITKLQIHQEHISQQLQLIKKAKKTIMYKVLR